MIRSVITVRVVKNLQDLCNAFFQHFNIMNNLSTIICKRSYLSGFTKKFPLIKKSVNFKISFINISTLLVGNVLSFTALIWSRAHFYNKFEFVPVMKLLQNCY